MTLTSEEVFKLKTLLSNEDLLASYTNLVVAGVISEEEFWETNKQFSVSLLKQNEVT